MHFDRACSRGCPQLRSRLGFFLVACMLGGWGLLSATGADLIEARRDFIRGRYAETVRSAEAAVQQGERQEDWRRLWIESLLHLGRYPEAMSVLSNSLNRYRASIQLRLLGYDVCLYNGQPARAKGLLAEINNLASSRIWSYTDPPNLVSLGRTALLLGADPRVVLENFFERAKKADPDYRESYLASGMLALNKHDYDLAAKIFSEGLKRFDNDPDLQWGLALGYAPSDRSQMMRALETALALNPQHAGAWLLQADHFIDSEEDAAAERSLEKALKVNPHQPEAWAYRAVLEHLNGDLQAEKKARQEALRFWPTNPKVDHLIGKKLSQKYRFAEGSAYQRNALQLEPDYLPAKIQLAQDLLRLGQEQEGWALAEEVHAKDGYDVVAYNLVTLNGTLSRFQTVTNSSFIVRMHPRESGVYGAQALSLLDRAKQTLCAKYGLELQLPIIVEVFPDQKDFAVRTFGLPGGEGFLGVCFGPVITANSPAAQAAHPANWEAVLWHEFCHVVTLQLTRNKMPRWLSEGISVYEERQAHPAWGQVMNPAYRKLILSGRMSKIADLSSAFLVPRSDMHLQFAYYQSSLVVEFLISQHGLEKLIGLLNELAKGIPINQAIEQQIAPLKKLENEFADFARVRAENLAPQLDFEEPPSDRLSDPTALAQWFEQNPTNFWALTLQAKHRIAENNWEAAKPPLLKLIELYPGYYGSDNAYHLLGEAHRNLGETNQEKAVLTKLAEIQADALETYQRLVELAALEKDWGTVTTNARRLLAVNPLLPEAHRYLAQASEQTGDAQQAIRSYRSLLLLDPNDRTEIHYRLAGLFHASDNPAAKRHLLQSLEEAPRYRAAHELLLKIVEGPSLKTEPAKEAEPLPLF